MWEVLCGAKLHVVNGLAMMLRAQTTSERRTIMAAEDLPSEVSLEELQSDCQERWDQAGGEQKAEDVQPPMPMPQITPTGEMPKRQTEG
jgi:hypothetical protein